MKQPLFIVLFFCCSHACVSAQDTLSPNERQRLLSNWGNTANSPEKRLSSIYLLAESLVATQPDSALSLSQTGIKTARSLNRSNDYARLLFIAGLSHHNLGNSNQSLRYFSQALPYYRQWDNKQEKGAFFWNLGNTWYRNSNYSKCLESYLFALKIRKSLHDTIGIMQCTNNIGLVYEQQSRLAQAKNYYRYTLSLALRTHNDKWICIASFNLSSCYRTEKNYAQAEQYLRQSLRISQKIKNLRFIGNCLSGFGDLYFDRANHTEALNYYQQAGDYIRKVNDKTELAIWQVQMGSVYNKLKLYKTAIAYCDSAIRLRTAGPALDYERFAHQIVADSYAKAGNYQQAYLHQLKYQAITDSIHNADNSQLLSDIRIRYELEQQETSLREETNRKLSEQQLIRNFIIGIAAIIVLLLLLLINRSRLKQKNRHQLELNRLQKQQAVAVLTTEEQERKRIARDLHDGLGQLLSAATLNLQRVPENTSPLIRNSLELITEASGELRNISFNLMPYSMAESGLAETIRELIARLERSFAVKFRLYIDGVEPGTMEPEFEMHVYRIVQEAINNSLKHAGASEISIQLIRYEDKLLVTIEDDGKGFDKARQTNPGMGLRNMTARTEWLKGEIAIDTLPGSGTVITLELPL